MKTKPEKTHALFPPSSAHRWVNCTASIKASLDAPKSPDNKYSIEGTNAHTCLEILLTDPHAVKILKADHPKEMVDHAAWAVKEINKLAPKDSRLLVETKVVNDFIDKDFHGTLDVAIVDEFGDLIIIDYKYGVVPVDPEENPQLISYALGIAHKYDYAFENVRLVILQPRAYQENERVRIWDMPIDKLRQDWRLIFTQRTMEARSDNPTYRAGEWCKYCPAAMNCPEISDRALASAKVDFDMATSEVTYPDQKSLSNESLALTLKAMDKIEFWITQTRAYAFNILNSGGKIEGFKLVPKRGSRKWIDESKVKIEAVKKFGKKVLTHPELLSPAQLEKVVPKEWVEKYTTVVSSGFSMVRDSDKREETSQIELDFAPRKTEKQKQIKQQTKKPTKGKK